MRPRQAIELFFEVSRYYLHNGVVNGYLYALILNLREYEFHDSSKEFQGSIATLLLSNDLLD